MAAAVKGAILAIDNEASFQDQAEIWKYMLNFGDSMALKCAVELRLPDILHSADGPMTLSEIAAAIPDAPSPQASHLFRVLRLLVRRKIFTSQEDKVSGETLYGPTKLSSWLLHEPAPTSDSDSSIMTLAPMLISENHPWHANPWHKLSEFIREGGLAPLEKELGCLQFDFAAKNPLYNKLLNNAMACTARITIRTLLSHCGDDLFNGVGSVVDVGGGTGRFISEIVKSYPHIKGINFDRPHVISTAPAYPGVTHVGGDMFQQVPSADAVVAKWVLHDWGDELCVKLLKNCRKAIPEKGGKVIIVDIVVEADGKGVFDDTGVVFDVLMLAHNTGGKERTEKEWKSLLDQSGFPRYKITKIPALQSVIEAYPN
ncbi:hypothetical protein CsatB_015660 [Cannabis sativa]